MHGLSNHFNESPDVSNEVGELCVKVSERNYGQICKKVTEVVKQTSLTLVFSAAGNFSVVW